MQNQKLTPEQAVQILDQATAQLNVSRAVHAQIVAALQVMQELAAKQTAA
jgi:hypothetical protein